MKPPATTIAAPAPLLLQRRSVIVAAAIVITLTIIALAGGGTLEIVFRLLTDGVFLLAWLAAAAGIGGLFFRLPRRPRTVAKEKPDPKALARSGGATSVAVTRVGPPGLETINIPGVSQSSGALAIPDAFATGPRPLLRDVVGTGPLKFATAIAIGLGIIGLATLFLGLAGLLNRATAFGLIGIGLALGVVWLRRANFTRATVAAWFSARTPAAWLWLAAAPVVGIVLVATFAPPGLLWSEEPNAYDVLSYHLQIPREWYETGRIHRLDHNAFGYFPQGVEIHYLLAMHLRGGPWAGMYLAQLMHACITLLSGAAVFAAAGAVAPRPQATVAGVAALVVPWVALLGPVAYNEGGLLFYGSLAIGWALQALMREHIGRPVILAGVMAGLACGAKLTAGPLLLAGLPLALLAGAAGVRPLGKMLIGGAAIAAIGLVVFAPWAVRTFAWSGGNPVFPEANGVFKSDRFTPVQNERWERAHAPLLAQKAPYMRLRAAREHIVTDWKFGYLLLPLGVVAMVLARGRPETWFLAALFAVIAVFWLGFTHLQGRFFVMAIPVAALALSQLDRQWLLWPAAALVVVQAIVTIGLVEAEPRFRLVREHNAFGIDLGRPQILAAVPPDAPVELIGDARAFIYPVPMSQLRYRTVFDVNMKPDVPIIESWLGGPPRPDAYIVFDANELLRFSRTYYGILPPPPDAPGLGEGPKLIPPAAPATPSPAQH